MSEEDAIPIKLDPGLISQTSFKDPYQINPETLSLYTLINRIDLERSEKFTGISEEDLKNEVINEQIEIKLKKQRERDGIDFGKSDSEKFQNIFEDLKIEEEDEQIKEEEEEESNKSTNGIDNNSTEEEEEESNKLTENENELTRKLNEQKELLKIHQNKKNEMIQSLRIAQNEASLSLEFISLLVSSIRPNAAITSMSPHLKQSVPLSSLNSDHLVNIDEKTNGKLQNSIVNQKVMIAWKLESLNHMKKLIDKKKQTLANETKRNKVYYQQLNDISITKCQNFTHDNDYKKYDEVLFKLNDKDIGIKFGFQGSGSKYKLDQGIGIFEKKKHSGELQFKSLNEKFMKYKILIKIFNKNEKNNEFLLISESKLINDDTEDILNVQKDIKNARNRIFEEELFYQLIKESKALLPYGVKIISNSKIIIELQNKLIEISYVAIKDEIMSENNDTEMDSKKADYVLNFLKLMLCYHHKKNLYESNSTITNSNIEELPLLLRPLIGNINHEQFVKDLINQLIQFYEIELNYKINIKKSSFNKINQELIYITTPNDLNPIKTKHLSIKILKNNNIARFNESQIFKRVITPTNSLIILNFAKDESLNKKFRLSIKTSSNNSFCDCLVNLNYLNDTIDVNYSEIGEIINCLKWAHLKYID